MKYMNWAELCRKWIKEKQTPADYKKQWAESNREKVLLSRKQYNQRIRNTKKGRARNLIDGYNNSDNKYNRGKCTLTPEWIIQNIFNNQKCVYCGEDDWTKLGCDRINNDLPHTPDNVVPCCKKCNKKRGTMQYIEFKKMLGI